MRRFGPKADTAVFRTQFFSADPQMAAVRSYVLETAAFESARNQLVVALSDLQRTQTHMFAASSEYLIKGSKLRGGISDPPPADAEEVIALVLARQKLADAQENLAIKAQRIDFEMLSGLTLRGTVAPDPAMDEAQRAYYGGSAFAWLFDVVGPLEHAVALAEPAGQTQADIPGASGKKERVSADTERQLAEFRL